MNVLGPSFAAVLFFASSTFAGDPLAVLGESVTVHLPPEETGGKYAVVEEVSPPGGGTPVHNHAHEDEILYVLEGELEVLLGEKTFRASEGSVVYLPRGVRHQFRNPGETPTRTLGFVAPGKFVGFFRDIDALAAEGGATPEKATALGDERYGLTIEPPPAE